MTSSFVLKQRRDAQTLIFFLLAFGTIFLLCGLAIDSGLLYLAKARLSRAVDGAALAAVGNFNVNPTDPVANRADVAVIMRNFAIANFTDLGTTQNGAFIPATAPSPTTSSTTSGGVTTTTYTYNFNDGTTDSNGQPRRYVEVVLTTGAGGQITSATCNARCPVQTYFIGYADGIIGGFRGISSLKDLKVSSAAVATRNPRLIMVVVDRSASMLQPGGGAFGLPNAIVTFLNFFDTSSDYIGIVSFSSNARLEMPLTTNFLNAGTNDLIDSYQLATNEAVGAGYTVGGVIGQPGEDPEMNPVNSGIYEASYSTNGVRRLKFGGDTAADEGMRMALECMMSNSGFNNPDVVKYIVLFTDGKWNNARSLLAAPAYTNIVYCPPSEPTNEFVTNLSPDLSGTLANASNVYFMPSLSPAQVYPYTVGYLTNSINTLLFDSGDMHTNDYWLSVDTNGEGVEPFSGSSNNPGGAIDGEPATIINSTFVGMDTNTSKPVYSTTVNIWLQPGSIDYYYHNGVNTTDYIGNFNSPTNTQTINMSPGDSNMLVVPGYVVDGCFYDGLDLPYPYAGVGNNVGYREDNYNCAFMWPDDTASAPSDSVSPFPYYSPWVLSESFMRNLLFRNYVNMLTGFYVLRADDPLSTETSATNQFTGTQLPLNGLGAYYPSAGFYWPFDLVGLDWDETYCLTNALIDPDATGNGLSRTGSHSINMLSTNADPEWAGELFYMGSGSTLSGSTAASSVMSSASDWQIGAPGWLTSANENDMYTDPTSDTTISPNPKVWRPDTFRGNIIGVTNSITTVKDLVSTTTPSATGGYVADNAGNIYSNSMSWNGRPTHYYNFANSTWVPLPTNHTKNATALPLGYWKAEEYAWHARAAGVTIYTVGYGTLVTDSQQVILAQMANATNTTGYNETNGGTNIPISYNSAQPIGAQYYADSTNAISNDFYAIGQAINAALTQ